jgi:DNA-binding response OmpR family regulator
MDTNRVIYLVEDDQKIGDKLLGSLNSAFPDFRTLLFNNYKDFESAFVTRRPTLIIFSLETEDGRLLQECIKLKLQDLEAHVDYLAIGNRTSLEKNQEELINTQIDSVPKPIRLQALLEAIENCLNRNALRDVKIFKLKKGQFLFKQGEEPKGIYVLRRGKVAVKVDRNGKTFVLKEITTPQMLGEMAFIDGSLRSASVEVLQDSEFLELDLSDFKNYMVKQPVWVKLLIDTLVQRLREMDDLYIEVLSKGN